MRITVFIECSIWTWYSASLIGDHISFFYMFRCRNCWKMWHLRLLFDRLWDPCLVCLDNIVERKRHTINYRLILVCILVSVWSTESAWWLNLPLNQSMFYYWVNHLVRLALSLISYRLSTFCDQFGFIVSQCFVLENCNLLLCKFFK